MSSSLESQDSCEDVVSDTAPKHHRNGSGDSPSSSPPKKQKVKRKKRLSKETVKEDTSEVLRSYLLRCESVKEEDLEEDLDTDAGDSDDEPDQKEIFERIAHRLKEIGDVITEKYKKDDSLNSQALNNFLSAAIAKDTIYESFKETLRAFCGNITQSSDPDLNSLAFVFFLTRRLTEATLEAGRRADELVRFGQQYINEMFGEWIEEQGGWGRVLGDGTEV